MFLRCSITTVQQRKDAKYLVVNGATAALYEPKFCTLKQQSTAKPYFQLLEGEKAEEHHVFFFHRSS